MLSQTVYIASTSRIKRTMLIENIVCEKCNNYLTGSSAGVPLSSRINFRHGMRQHFN